MKLVVLGLSLSSAWGNGHATTYRSLLKAFAARGHEVVFLERDVPWYSGPARDMADPAFCRLVLYRDLAAVYDLRPEIASADAVMVGSYVPDGIAVGDLVQDTARGVTCFYDIDTPVTLAEVAKDACKYLRADQIGRYAVYFSFTGGPTLELLRTRFKAPDPRALYCCVDPDLYQPRDAPVRWDLSYLGTYSPDRQPVLERLLIEPARRAPHLRFVVAGPQYPAEIAWPENVERFEHVGPHDHAEFYGVSRYTLNVTRAAMVRAGYSPSVRLFEAAACETAIISDVWNGIETVFTPGDSIALARNAEDVLTLLDQPSTMARGRMAARGRAQVLAGHTAAHRATELEDALNAAARRQRG